jgi:hypothetical protein
MRLVTAFGKKEKSQGTVALTPQTSKVVLDFIPHPERGQHPILTGWFFYPVCVVVFLLSFFSLLVLSGVYQMNNCFLPMGYL